MLCFVNKVSFVTWLTGSDHRRRAAGLCEHVVDGGVFVVDVGDVELLQGRGVGVGPGGREVGPGGWYGRALILRFCVSGTQETHTVSTQ